MKKLSREEKESLTKIINLINDIGIAIVSIFTPIGGAHLSCSTLAIKNIETFETEQYTFNMSKFDTEEIILDLLKENNLKYFKSFYTFTITNPEILRKKAINKEIKIDIKKNPARTTYQSFHFQIRTKRYIQNIFTESVHIFSYLKSIVESEIFPLDVMLKGIPAEFQGNGNVIEKYLRGTLTDADRLLLALDHPELVS